jgi:hypothetical protein
MGDVAAQLVELHDPSLGVFIGVAGSLLLRPGEVLEAAFDDAEPGPGSHGGRVITTRVEA